jgi:hypothetical protein
VTGPSRHLVLVLGSSCASPAAPFLDEVRSNGAARILSADDDALLGSTIDRFGRFLWPDKNRTRGRGPKMQDANLRRRVGTTLPRGDSSLPDATARSGRSRAFHLQFASVRRANWPLRSLFMAGQNSSRGGQHRAYKRSGSPFPTRNSHRFGKSGQVCQGHLCPRQASTGASVVALWP